jgi:hypothetical protein
MKTCFQLKTAYYALNSKASTQRAKGRKGKNKTGYLYPVGAASSKRQTTPFSFPNTFLRRIRAHHSLCVEIFLQYDPRP